MNVELSPHLLVRQFLKRQRHRKQAYRDWFDHVYARDWATGNPKGQQIHSMSLEYLDQLRNAGATDLRQAGSPAKLKLRSASGFDVSGFALWPIALGTSPGEVDEAFSEQALMIVRLGASFTSKKVAAHEAPLAMGLTRHAIERMMERGALSSDIDADLHKAAPHLLGDIALALAFSIAKTAEGEPHWAGTAFVPFAGGMVIVTNRMMTSGRLNQDFGWRFNFTKRRYTWCYLKPDLMLDSPDRSMEMGGCAQLSTWFVTTFVARNQLYPDQRAYLDAFSAWRNAMSERDRYLAIRIQTDPDFRFDEKKHRMRDFPDDDDTVDRLRYMLTSSAFPMHEREAFAFLIEAGTGTRAFQRLHRAPA